MNRQMTGTYEPLKGEGNYLTFFLLKYVDIRLIGKERVPR